MNEIIDAVHQFISGAGPLVYTVIFLGRLFDVSCSTLRVILVSRGERLIGSIIAFFEVTVWLLVASAVLAKPDALKIIFYALAYASGTYLGSLLDDKLALGLSSIQVIMPDYQKAELLCSELRSNGFGVSTLDAHGIDNKPRQMILLNARRKTLPRVLEIISSVDKDAFVTVSDVKMRQGGYMPGTKRR